MPENVLILGGGIGGVAAANAPLQPPRALTDSGLIDESGWVRVERRTMETRFPGVYAIGDVTMIPLAMGKPLPRAGVFAHGQAEVVARNIARVAGGKGAETRFDGHGSCFIETGVRPITTPGALLPESRAAGGAVGS